MNETPLNQEGDSAENPRRLSPTAWKKGQSGNPAGRPARGKSLAERARMLTRNGRDVIAFWTKIMNDPKESTHDRIRCSENLMERAFGKSPTTFQLGEEGSAPVQIQIISYAAMTQAGQQQIEGGDLPAIEIQSFQSEGTG